VLPVSPGIFRGPQPKNLEEFQFVARQGIRTIIDLENERGEAQWEAKQCEEASILFHSLPMTAFGFPQPETVRAALSFLACPVHHPILVHCLHGQDRTGLIVALHRVRSEGWPKWRAWEEMVDHGYHRVLLRMTLYFWMG
jgi:tyrosine-protein phosphatase SIW14